MELILKYRFYSSFEKEVDDMIFKDEKEIDEYINSLTTEQLKNIKGVNK